MVLFFKVWSIGWLLFAFYMVQVGIGWYSLEL
jgi:hypothetical protein